MENNYSKHIIRSTVTLRIFGENLEPDEITNLLGINPTGINKKGELTFNEKGESTYDSGGWELGSETNDKEDIEDKIKYILNSTTSDLSVWKKITKRYSVDLFCGIFMKRINMGFSLPLDIIEMLADRGISIGFDIYYTGEDSR